MLEQNIKKINHSQVFVFFFSIIVFFSPLFYFDLLHNPSALPRSALFAIASGIMFVSVAVFISKHKSQIILTTQLNYLFLFVLWSSLSLIWSVHSPSSYNQLMQLWPLFLVFIFSSQLKQKGALKVIVVLSVVAAFMAAIIGLWQNWGMELFGLRYHDFMGSTFYLNNHAVLYFDLIFPVSLALIIVTVNKYAKWLFAIMSGSILGYLLESHTRGSWLALAILLLMLLTLVFLKNLRLFVLKKCKHSWLMLLFVILLGSLIFLAPGQIDKKWQVKTQTTALVEGGASVRIVSYRNAVNLLSDNLITGVGYGAFWKAFREYTNTPLVNSYSDEYRTLYRLHSDIYQIFIETGLIGGFLFIGFLFYSIKSGVRIIRSHKNEDERILLAGVLLAVLASLVHSLVDFPLLKPSSALQLFLWLGLIASFSDGRVINVPDNRAFKMTVVAVSVFYFVIVVIFYFYYLIANYYFYKADIAYANNNCPEAKVYIDKSVDLFGLHLFSRLKRVDVYLQCEKSEEVLFNVLTDELSWNDTETAALLKRGDMYYEFGLFQKSQRDYAKVMDILPHRPLAAFKMAVTVIASGNEAQGIEQLKMLEKKFPDFKPVKNLLLKLDPPQKKQ